MLSVGTHVAPVTPFIFKFYHVTTLNVNKGLRMGTLGIWPETSCDDI